MQKNTDTIVGINPATRQPLEGEYPITPEAEIDRIMHDAAEAFHVFRNTSGKDKAKLLRAIADEILNLGDELVMRAMGESGLPQGRIEGERGRTVGQLRLFADLVEEGSWVEARIDTAIPDRSPVPKPDIRQMLVPVGPVVVFTASNFPLAFSTAGGDTASALAAGNPVVVKAHESHPGTHALVSKAISKAIRTCGLPEGIYGSVYGGYAEGGALVRHRLTKSVAFTGSFRGGKALYDIAAAREEPIPVFAEMGSINPVILLKGALEKRGEEIANTYAGSVTLGAGQFCTNPGLLVGVESPALNQFIDTLAMAIADVAPATMLSEKIYQGYEYNRAEMLKQAGIELEGAASEADGWVGCGTVTSVSGATFLENDHFQEEVFGPFTLVVRCQSAEEMKVVIGKLHGQLTTTVMAEEDELGDHVSLLEELREKTGRLIFNGVPTGVEVCHSMHHGGPYPATTDSRFTSVGTLAIRRFVRPVAYQSWPDNLLPDELKAANPLGIWRLVDGKMKQL